MPHIEIESESALAKRWEFCKHWDFCDAAFWISCDNDYTC